MKKTIVVTEACAVLGSRLKQARLEKNLTQLELSKLLGVSRGKIVEAEKGYTTIETFVAIIIVLEKENELEAILPDEPLPHQPEIMKKPRKLRQRASGNSGYAIGEPAYEK